LNANRAGLTFLTAPALCGPSGRDRWIHEGETKKAGARCRIMLRAHLVDAVLPGFTSPPSPLASSRLDGSMTAHAAAPPHGKHAAPASPSPKSRQLRVFRSTPSRWMSKTTRTKPYSTQRSTLPDGPTKTQPFRSSPLQHPTNPTFPLSHVLFSFRLELLRRPIICNRSQ